MRAIKFIRLKNLNNNDDRKSVKSIADGFGENVLVDFSK